MMLWTYYFFVGFLSLATILPLFRNQYWVFRVCEMARIQIAYLQSIVFIAGFFFFAYQNEAFVFSQSILLLMVIYNGWVLLPFTSLYKKSDTDKIRKGSKSVSLISINVLQFNTDYERLINLVRKQKPDILLTIESNKNWENALSVLESDYKYTINVPQENTYGMHLYSKLPFGEETVNYFVADDVPSIEVQIQTPNKAYFKLYGIHPPPPSPTQEKNSKERDGDLLCIAKDVQNERLPVIVIGDFNNVAWAKSSKLFKKTSGLIDPRIGRGLVSTFHADYRFFQFPIDLTYHSKEIFIEDFKTLETIGSDHLPLYCKFFLNNHNDVQKRQIKESEAGDEEVVEEIIEEGKKETTEARNPK